MGNQTVNDIVNPAKAYRRKTAAMVAVILSAALLLTGTYAVIDNVLHNTNQATGGNEISLTLNDNYTPPSDWKVSDPAVSKTVSVSSSPVSTASAWIRLQFKEYFEFDNFTEVTDNGEEVLIATYADGQNKGEYMLFADMPAGFKYTAFTVGNKVYARTQNAELKNGIYGKKIYIEESKVFGQAEKADYSSQPHEAQNGSNAECNYEVHKWLNTGHGDDCGIHAADGDTIHNYISWTLGEDVIMLADWLAGNIEETPKWILDPATGWAYWGQALESGASTEDIMKSIKLDEMPDGLFEYYIHIDMQAATRDEFFNTIADGSEYPIWEDAPDDLLELIKREVTGFSVSSTGLGTGVDIVDQQDAHTFELTSSANPITVTFTGNVTGQYLPTPALTHWVSSGDNAAWGAAETDSESYTVTIPAYASGQMTLTATSKDDPSKTISLYFNVIPSSAKIFQLSGGGVHSLAIDSNGQLYGWGYNGYGRIGDNTTVERNVPTKLTNVSHIKFKQVVAGNEHSLGIDYDGNLYAWGYGGSGALGLGNADSQSSPQKIAISGDPNFVKVAIARYSSIALDEEGNIWTWGSGELGFHGDGGTATSLVPVKMTNFGGETPVFVDIAANSIYAPSALAVDQDGNIWGWGGNAYGNLGLGNATAQYTPTIIYIAETGHWTATSTTGSYRQVVDLAPGTKMVSAIVGWGMGGAMDENGSIYAWGSNIQSDMALGIAGGEQFPPNCIYDATTGDWLAPQTPDFGEPCRIVHYTMGSANVLAIDELGNVYTWGYNVVGQLGIGSTANREYATKIYDASTGLFAGGTSLPAGTKIIDATGNNEHMLFLSENGEAFAVGGGGNYRLGYGTPAPNTANQLYVVRISSGETGSAFPITE